MPRDLLGFDEEHSPQPGDKINDGRSLGEMDIRSVLKGVSVAWLSQVFRMDPATVKRKLVDCPTLGRARNTWVYDIVQATQYLVKPKVDVAQWVKTLRPADLPAYLQSEFWEAQNKRQKWEENAGELWRTEKVVETFAEVFKLIKDTTNLWIDGLEREKGVTVEQRAFLTKEIDSLNNQIHESMNQLAAERKTTNVKAELDNIEGEVRDKDKRARMKELI